MRDIRKIIRHYLDDGYSVQGAEDNKPTFPAHCYVDVEHDTEFTCLDCGEQVHFPTIEAGSRAPIEWQVVTCQCETQWVVQRVWLNNWIGDGDDVYGNSANPYLGVPGQC